MTPRDLGAGRVAQAVHLAPLVANAGAAAERPQALTRAAGPEAQHPRVRIGALRSDALKRGQQSVGGGHVAHPPALADDAAQQALALVHLPPDETGRLGVAQPRAGAQVHEGHVLGVGVGQQALDLVGTVGLALVLRRGGVDRRGQVAERIGVGRTHVPERPVERLPGRQLDRHRRGGARGPLGPAVDVLLDRLGLQADEPDRPGVGRGAQQVLVLPSLDQVEHPATVGVARAVAHPGAFATAGGEDVVGELPERLAVPLVGGAHGADAPQLRRQPRPAHGGVDGAFGRDLEGGHRAGPQLALGGVLDQVVDRRPEERVDPHAAHAQLAAQLRERHRLAVGAQRPREDLGTPRIEACAEGAQQRERRGQRGRVAGDLAHAASGQVGA